MLGDYRTTVKREPQMWHESYLPVQGTVVDMGAGCGETAFFYLHHGAEHVVCIEPSPAALACLRENFGNDPRVTILPFKIGHLKVDIEGGEEGMAVETHFPIRWKRMFDIPGSKHNVIVWRLTTLEAAFSLLSSAKVTLSSRGTSSLRHVVAKVHV